MAKNEDAAIKGTAVEHLVASSCILMSDMTLNVSTSLIDDEGVDLVFHRRGDSATIAVQVKSRFTSAATIERDQKFIANVGESTFRPRPDLFMLFVVVDSAAGTFDPVWWVPSEEFHNLTTVNGKGRRRISASLKSGTKDKWSRFRASRQELPEAIVSALTR